MHKNSLQSSRLAERRYKQMLEDEQTSLARNKKLLDDIDRLEEEMRYFSLGFKQDEERLNQAKNKFMQYVKSVYPQWTEDVKKWKEARKGNQNKTEQSGPFGSSRYHLHSTQNRKNNSFTNYEMSPTRSVPDSRKSYEDSFEYPRFKMEDSRDNVGYSRTEIGHTMDMNRTYMDQKGHSKDTLEHSRNMMDYSNDRMGYSMGFSSDRVGYSRDRMACLRNMPGSLRETKDLSWDEMGFSRGYPRNNIGYPAMYNGGPWMYPQNAPPGRFSYPSQPFFAPMPVPYGGPRWSTPDQWYNPNGRNYEHHETIDKQDVSRNGKEFSQNGREMQSDFRETECSNQQQQSHDGEGFTNHSYITGPEDATRKYHYPGQRLEGSNGETDLLKNRVHEDGEKPRRLFPGKQGDERLEGRDHHRIQGGSEELVNHQTKGKLIGRMVAPENDRQENRGASNKEELTDRTTISEHFDGGKESRRTEREYVGEPLRDTRLMQLRSEGKFGSGEAMNTDSISLPTLHQYEGDPRDIFSDISESEPLNVSCREDTKPKKQGDGFNRESLNQAGTTVHIDTREDNGNSSSIRRLSQAGSCRAESKSSQGMNNGDISNSQSLSQDGGNRVGSKHSLEKKESESAPKDSHVESSAPGSDRRFLKHEVSEKKSSVVEDLIGDDVSDLEISEVELSDDELKGKEEMDDTLVSVKVKNDGVVVTGGVGNRTDDGVRIKQGELKNEILAEVGRNEISSDEDGLVESVHSNESTRKHDEVKEDVASTGSKESGEILVIDDNGKENVTEQNKKDKNIKDGMSQSIDESISEELAKTDSYRRETDVNVGESRPKTDASNVQEMKKISPSHKTEDVKDESLENEDTVLGESRKVKSKIAMNAETESSAKQDSKIESRKAGESVDKRGNEEIISEDDEKSKSGVLEISFSSAESTSESIPAQEKSLSMKSESKLKESVSYSEDFEDDKSIPLTQSAAYQKMLSTVDVSDEEDDLEEEFLEGTMSEANTTAQSTHTMPQTFQDSGKANLPVKSSKSKPTLSLFSSGERDDFGGSIGNDGVGVPSPSWKSSEGSLSPPLSPDTGGYVPTLAAAGKVEKKGEEKEGGEAVVSVGENKDGKVEKGKKLQESDTKSRIQAGFWNNSESESEIDLQISHGGNDNNDDDDDDFDFYS